MSQVEPNAGSYSLWLLLCEEDEVWVRGLISALAGELGTEAFFPHVTLMGALSEDPTQATAALPALAESQPLFAAEIDGIGMQPSVFTAFFLRLRGHPALTALHERAKDFGGGSVSAPMPFMPHISLAYGHIDEGVKRSLRARLEGEFAGRSIRFDRIAYAYSGVDIPITRWRIDACVSLAYA
ncbi:2'-5' RNA ligase family protein [Denitrobaculum tricleocarpae]|uniref:2'-5' RNA ligase family protein n=1 Tax=Denitrobaculum tricleocarpae TaxID=2591009 RepID=A0A545TEZ3_9PROT|nr:2'-5' RNA ligase family protein [Denitrobaculum tricleocarpae]TQV75755.1 2'-5' RNA ligase family protein [Denitrobaculum tricleocarpae]